MIRRDPRGAATTSYDLIVLGGGIYGVSVALEAARSGYRPLLLERADFGGATTWNNLRIVHGGLRYLQTFDLPRIRESVKERRWFLAHFPELVRPLPCLMPLHGRGLQRPSLLGLALSLNDLFSWDRNRGVPENVRLPPGRMLSAQETAVLYPEVPRAGLRGAAKWYDAAMSSPQRVLIEMLHWACAAGASCLNYMEASELMCSGGKVSGVGSLDRLSERAITYRAPVVVNCAGPWSRSIAGDFDRDIPRLFRPSLAFNLLLDRQPIAPVAVAVTSPRPGGGTYLLCPWEGKTFVGTFHGPPVKDVASARTGSPRPSDEEVQSFLRELNEVVPALAVGRGEVLRVYAGYVPLDRKGGLASRETVHDHGAAGGPRGLFSLAGVKFTTARAAACKLLSRVYGEVRPSGARPDRAGEVGSTELTAEEFQSLLQREPEAAAAYVRDLAADESVQFVDDLLLRRTDWAADPRQGSALSESVAELIDRPSASVGGDP